MLSPGQIHLACAPMYHTAPLVFASYALLVGGTLVIQPSWDALAALNLIATHRINTAFLPPILVKRLTALPEEDTRGYHLPLSDTDRIRIRTDSGTALLGIDLSSLKSIVMSGGLPEHAP